MMVRLLNAFATRIKGRPFVIDHEIGIIYLLRVAVTRTIMAVRGWLRFPLSRKVFIGRGVRIWNSSSLHLGRSVVLAPNVFIDALSREGVHLANYCTVGKNTRIECTGSISSIGKGLMAGENSALGTDCFYGAAGGITIGSDTIVGNFVSFHSENHVISQVDVSIHSQGVTRKGISIGSDCWIGSKATILDGVNLGDGSVVAAGAVLAGGEYPGYSIYGGVPARKIGVRGPS